MENEIAVIALCEVPQVSYCPMYGYQRLPFYDDEKGRGIEVFVRAELKANIFRSRKRSCIVRIDTLDMNMAVVHLNSERTPNMEDYHSVDISVLINDLAATENQYDHNTILVGDFNVNILDPLILSIVGLNARLFRYQMDKENETKHELKRELFYSPMLEIYKDNESEDKPKGTYFFESNVLQWVCFDQLFVRNKLLYRYVPRSLKILDELIGNKLVKNHRPDFAISDHLPIYFEFKEVGING